MYRVNNISAASTLAAPINTGTPGYFTNGTPGTTEATVVDADWLNTVQEELANAITSSGQTLSETNRSQLAAALSGRLLRTTIYTNVDGTQYVQVDGGAATTTGATTFTPLAQANATEIEVDGDGDRG